MSEVVIELRVLCDCVFPIFFFRKLEHRGTRTPRTALRFLAN